MKIKVLSARFIAALKRKIDIDLDMYGSIQLDRYYNIEYHQLLGYGYFPIHRYSK